MHPREALRHGLVRLLKGEPHAEDGPVVYPVTRVEDRVYPNRPTPLMEMEVPCLCVWFDEETSNTDRDMSRRKYDRTVTIYIEAVVYGDAHCDDALDDIAEEVESVLLGKRVLKDPVTGKDITDDWYLSGSRLELVGEETDQVIASLLMMFRAQYASEATYRNVSTPYLRMGAKVLGAEGQTLIQSENEREVPSA